MITEFIGKFHPLLVHLPIGFFLLAFVLKVISFWKNKESIESILPIMLILSFLAAAFSSLTGYLLSQGGDYDSKMIDKHQWSGIAFTSLILGVYFFRNNQKLNLAFWTISAILLIFVGHLGGNLTHGEDFLSFQRKLEKKSITNIQSAKVYDDLVRPILEEKCYSCHSSKKQKGKLRLDKPEFILKGGKEGKSVVPHHSEQSLISKRIFMPEREEEHMPPKGKSQLTLAETKILEWWIKEGASFEKLVKDLNQSSEIKATLLSFQGSESLADSPKMLNIPEREVEKGSEQSIASLTKAGILVIPVANNSNYLYVNFRGIAPTDKEIKQLENLRSQIIWMNASRVGSVEGLSGILSELTELRVLHLNNTSFSDKQMPRLSRLAQLQTLNLSNTDVTAKGLRSIQSLSRLKKIFLYQSKTTLNASEFKNFPKIKIDTGGYKVPTFETDTIEITS